MAGECSEEQKSRWTNLLQSLLPHPLHHVLPHQHCSRHLHLCLLPRHLHPNPHLLIRLRLHPRQGAGLRELVLWALHCVMGRRDSHFVTAEIESAIGRKNVGKELASCFQESLLFWETRLKLLAGSWSA